MRILVSDTSVLIDLERGRLLEATFAIGWEFAVPDLLYKTELEASDGPQLLKLGLRVESLDGDGVRQALAYRAHAPALTLADSFALTLAKINAWTLLAGDGELRKLAHAEKVDYHGVLWMLDQLLEHKVVTPKILHRALTTISLHPRCRLPARDVRNRLEHYLRLAEDQER
jgi:hypothetical protein